MKINEKVLANYANCSLPVDIEGWLLKRGEVGLFAYQNILFQHPSSVAELLTFCAVPALPCQKFGSGCC
jgi:hypothetical protein